MLVTHVHCTQLYIVQLKNANSKAVFCANFFNRPLAECTLLLAKSMWWALFLAVYEWKQLSFSSQRQQLKTFLTTILPPPPVGGVALASLSRRTHVCERRQNCSFLRLAWPWFNSNEGCVLESVRVNFARKLCCVVPTANHSGMMEKCSICVKSWILRLPVLGRRFLGRIRGVTGREVVVGIIVSYFYHFLTTFIQVEQKVVLPEGPRLGGLAQRFRGGSEANPIYFRFSIPSARRQCLNDQHNEKYKRYVHFTKLASGGTLK